MPNYNLDEDKPALRFIRFYTKPYYTQRQLAIRAGLGNDQPLISDIENRRVIPSPTELVKIATALRYEFAPETLLLDLKDWKEKFPTYYELLSEPPPLKGY